MSTPDKFFKVNPDLKPGVVPRDQDDNVQAKRPESPPQSDKDFQKILDKNQDKPTEDPNKIAKELPKETDYLAQKDPTLAKEEKLEAFVKQTTQPDLDPRFNQAPTIDKDSKVAPKLGKEMAVAPAEEPRAMGYIEGKNKVEGKITLPGEKLAEKGKTEVEPDNIVKAMPAEKQAMQLPKVELPEKPDQLVAQKQAGDVAPLLKEKEIPKSPDELFSSLAIKPKQLIADAGKAKLEGKEDHPKLGALKSEEAKGKEHQPLAEENTVNLMGGGQGPQQGLATAAEKVQQSPASTKAHEIIQQIVDRISVVSTDAQSDTTITLRNIPKFEGVQVTVTSYPTARGEINITFENLTQEGKLILDMVDNRAALKQALDQKGFIVHMITTTTTTIERTYVESGGANREGRGGTKDEMAGGGGGQQRQNQEQDA